MLKIAISFALSGALAAAEHNGDHKKYEIPAQCLSKSESIGEFNEVDENISLFD